MLNAMIIDVKDNVAVAIEPITKGDTITFATPTTTGEFMADDSSAHNIFETAVVDTVAAAEAWITAVLQ